MTDQGYYRVSVKGTVVDQDGRFLLSLEDNGKWELLGGGLDHGEDPVSCLKREILEETGLEVTYISDTPKYFITSPRHGHDTFIANVIYEIQLKNLEFVPSDECQELRFFNVKEARNLDLFPNVEKFLDVFDAKLHTAA